MPGLTWRGLFFYLVSVSGLLLINRMSWFCWILEGVTVNNSLKFAINFGISSSTAETENRNQNIILYLKIIDIIRRMVVMVILLEYAPNNLFIPFNIYFFKCVLFYICKGPSHEFSLAFLIFLQSYI